LFVDARGLFNESHAKNIGIKAATGEYVFCVNADIILPSDTVSALIASVKHEGAEALYQMQRMDCPPESDLTDLSSAKPYNLLACGDLQGAHRDVWARLCGYDEHMSGWGWMDIDLVLRAYRMGVRQHWVAGHVIYHQYHPENPVRRNRLNIVYTAQRERLGVRLQSWGETARADVFFSQDGSRRDRERAFREGYAWVQEGGRIECLPKDPKSEAVFFDGARIQGYVSAALARRIFGSDIVYASRRMTVRTALFCNTIAPRFGGVLGAMYLYRQCKAERILCEEVSPTVAVYGGFGFMLECAWFVFLKVCAMPLTVMREGAIKATLRRSLALMERSKDGQRHHPHV
jgi:glycosyltransferase involved in cell wall biosynthesis